MWRFSLASLLALSMSAPAPMLRDSIALDNAAYLGFAVGNLTTAYTVTGSNPILFVGVNGSTNSDDVTGVTYNGVSMTLVDKNLQGGAFRYIYVFALVGPATGSHNVVVSTVGNFTQAIAVSYTGASQTGQPDAHGTANESPTFFATVTLTTVADNDWTVILGHGPSIAPQTGTTQRAIDTDFASILMGDSNGAITPPGSTSMSVSSSGAPDAIMAAFKPAGGAAPAFPNGIINFPIRCCRR